MSAMDERVRELLTRAAQRVLERFGRDDNVTGVAVGFRRRGGAVTDEPVVTVMVKKKRRPSLISRHRLIPSAIDVDGISCPTDVVQAQAVLMSADDTPPLLPDMFRPLQFGCGISNFSDPRPDAGTMGPFVRDNTDGTIGFLTANHVIADNNQAPLNDPVFQPASLDDPSNYRIARLKRFVPIVGGATSVDVALAQLERTARPISGYHGATLGAPTEHRPAVGMIVAGDGFGNVWLTRMSTTLRAIDATLLPDDRGPNVEMTPPALYSKLEKVGRTTSKTVGRVMGTGRTVDVDVPGQGIVRYTDLIWTQWMGWNGDSGAMVIRKGGPLTPYDGDEGDSRDAISRLIRGRFDPCEVLTAIQYAYRVPATEDEALADDVRDRFMAQSDVGRFLITLTYLNTQLVRDRLSREQSARDQAYAQTLYDHYQPLMSELMANPNSTTVITQQDADTYNDLLTALAQSGVITATERNAAFTLGQQNQAMLGMNRTQVIDHMNQASTLATFQNAVQQMPSVELFGPARAMDALD